jgi:hypothetical protein
MTRHRFLWPLRTVRLRYHGTMLMILNFFITRNVGRLKEVAC